MAMQVIQPHNPKQNGYVERCQRTWRKELYETSSVALPSTSTGAMPGASWSTITMSGPMPHLTEERPLGIYTNTMERASVAT